MNNLCLGTKLYYSNITGNTIYIRNDIIGVYLRETTFDEDYLERSEFIGYNKEAIELLTFEYGVYGELSKGSTGVRVDLETKELIFSYDEIPVPPTEPTLEQVVEEQGNKISILEQENANINYTLMMGGLL